MQLRIFLIEEASFSSSRKYDCHASLLDFDILSDFCVKADNISFGHSQTYLEKYQSKGDSTDQQTSSLRFPRSFPSTLRDVMYFCTEIHDVLVEGMLLKFIARPAWRT